MFLSKKVWVQALDLDLNWPKFYVNKTLNHFHKQLADEELENTCCTIFDKKFTRIPLRDTF